MRYKTFWIVVFLTLTITVLGVLFVTLDKDLDKMLIENPYIVNDSYTICEYQGKIAIFKGDESVPIEIYDVYVSTLPQHDRLLLEQGITVETPKELQKIIEDYTS